MLAESREKLTQDGLTQLQNTKAIFDFTYSTQVHDSPSILHIRICLIVVVLMAR